MHYCGCIYTTIDRECNILHPTNKKKSFLKKEIRLTHLFFTKQFNTMTLYWWRTIPHFSSVNDSLTFFFSFFLTLVIIRWDYYLLLWNSWKCKNKHFKKNVINEVNHIVGQYCWGLRYLIEARTGCSIIHFLANHILSISIYLIFSRYRFPRSDVSGTDYIRPLMNPLRELLL